MKNFIVKISEKVFEEMPFMKKTSFEPEKLYRVIATAGEKFVLVNKHGEMIELYPRKCIYVQTED